VPQFRQPGDQVFEVAVEAGVDAELVVPRIGEIEAHGKLVDAGFPQRQVFLLGHQRPVRYQNGVRQLRAVLDGADNLHYVVAHQRLSARHLHHAGP